MNHFGFYLKVLIPHCAGVWHICAYTRGDPCGLSGVFYLYLTVLDRVFQRGWLASKLLGDLPGSTILGHVRAGDSSSGPPRLFGKPSYTLSHLPRHFSSFFWRTVFLNAVFSADSFFFHWLAQFCQESRCYPSLPYWGVIGNWWLLEKENHLFVKDFPLVGLPCSCGGIHVHAHVSSTNWLCGLSRGEKEECAGGNAGGATGKWR